MNTLIFERTVEKLYYVFQPIVSIHTGTTFGFEALLRGYEETGFSSIFNLFDAFFEEKVLYKIDLILREKAVTQFMSLGHIKSTRLFYNIDNRVLQMPDYSPGNTHKIISKAGLDYDKIYFELSEKHELSSCTETQAILSQYRQQNYHIVLDDFGRGYSGLKSLYDSKPELIKIDRFFIAGIDTDSKKRIFVNNIVEMAHLMGIKIIAEGVETLKEFYVCREIGCDYVQGFLIQRPSNKRKDLLKRYINVENFVKNHKRISKDSRESLLDILEVYPTINISVPMLEVLSRFKENTEIPFFPIVNENKEPLGLVTEKSLKHYVYSPFGISILRNKTYGNDIKHFLKKAVILEITTPIEKILEYFAIEKDSDAIIITEDGKYRGLLESRSLLQLLYEKEIAKARDQNPLSKLPGNNTINEIIAQKIDGELANCCFVYFDFDFFKPFNDLYGFRQGDRAILLFADLLREFRKTKDDFIGHIGGDDFIIIITLKEKTLSQFLMDIEKLIQRFNEAVFMFYGKKEQEKGCITTADREGVIRVFPLLTVSAGIIYFPRNVKKYSLDKLSRRITILKKKAKKNPKHLAYSIIKAYNQDKLAYGTTSKQICN